MRSHIAVLCFCRWIKEMEGARLKEVAAHDQHFMRTMERAIRVGESVLLKVSTS